MTQAGVHCAVAQTMHTALTLSCLLQTFCRRSPLNFQRSLSTPADYPTVRAFFPFLPTVTHLAFSDFFFLSFFHPTWLQGDFSCLFRCPKTSVNVQQVLCENWSICRCILDVVVRKDGFCVLLFHHLDDSCNIFKIHY